MISASTLRLIGLAIAGILVAAAVAVAASQLASRQIGLASEPVSAGDELAPPAARSHHERQAEGENWSEPSAGETTTTVPATGAAPEAPSSSSGETPSITEPATGSEPPATSGPMNPPDDSSQSGGAGEGGGGSGAGHSDD